MMNFIRSNLEFLLFLIEGKFENNIDVSTFNLIC